MRKSVRGVAAVIASVAIALLAPATLLAAPGGGADVVKLECGFLSPTTGLSYAEGDGQIKNNPSGRSTASCTGLTLVAGQSAVTETTRTSYPWGDLTCEATEFANGGAKFFCR